MKNALILHGTQGSPRTNWFQWLKKELEKKGYKVWVPKLPKPEKPRVSRNVKYIFNNKNWQFNSESILIGHSSGPATILGLLDELPDEIIVNKCIFISAFTEDDWEPNVELFDYNYDFRKIKTKAKKFILIHSDNDPYVPLKQSKDLAVKLNGKLIMEKGQGHFNLEKSPQYKKFPLLLKLIDEI
ncbi:MAG: hypothetical protein US60_C0017G0016 [Microgenomates group bacterium GW2011_GWC1_37_8]|uniref:Serine hydrolase family protein n=1 Tax=Candidatus Woesebacteria bacterium GW2011_GWB1_38_8 TaxID=1618570 RepID=A0A0G0LE38_9BACT|nr:MAG: hypothetical protein US60_C0017G0016 [Microgenomates group bacterium GW2011_GWC1_37_8]KKQ86190.1 MAG: hypothetical protein UT08_C0001G0056 [Candidatus Woesebacteria bacterium GW2011_GWB1_38_8]